MKARSAQNLRGAAGRDTMFPMLRLAAVCTVGLSLSLRALAQEPTPNPENTALELKSLRETVQLQSQQLEKISQQLDDVLHRLGMKGGPPRSAAATPQSTPEAAAPPKAELAEGQTMHVVKKGETLTAIAHQYGLTVDQLQKANHITDGRRLQIDQNLIIPAATAKTVSPSPQPSAQ